jgi:hypothetical protein
MKILIMPSTDGQDYASACLIPDEMTKEEADRLVRQASEAENAREAKEETWDWNWDNFRASLEIHGFQFPDVIGGDEPWDGDGWDGGDGDDD